MAGVAGKSGTNKGKDKPFRDALRMELAAVGEDHRALRLIARNLITLATKDDDKAMPAIREVADRLDGKPAQAIVGGDEDDNPVSVLHKIERVIVNPDNQDR